MPALIVVHGVGDPSEVYLMGAAQGIGAAFPDVPKESRFSVNWNQAAADRILYRGQFRWRSVDRLFAALQSAIQIGWPSTKPRSLIESFFAGVQHRILRVAQLCFAAVILATFLIPAFGLASVASVAFLFEGRSVLTMRDLLDPTAYWFVPPGFLAAIMTTGFYVCLIVLRVVGIAWIVAVLLGLIVAGVECLCFRSTIPFRIALRRVFLGLGGPVVILLILPVYDFRPTVAWIAGVVAAPIVFGAGILGGVAAIFLSLATLMISGRVDWSFFLTSLLAFGYALAIGVCVLAAVCVLTRIRPAFGHVLKVLFDILLYAGDPKFRSDMDAAFDNVIALARAQSPDGNFVIAAHSLGSVIALESLLSSPQWCELDTIFLVTMGSPIRRFFWRFFPDLAFPGTPGEAATAVAGRVAMFRWVNVYRPLDQIGSSLQFATGFAARDISTAQWGRFLSAHVNYWNDRAVQSTLETAKAAAGRVPPARASLAWKRTDNDGAADVEYGNMPRVVRVGLRLIPLVFLALFLGMFMALWVSADRVDKRLAEVQAKFASGGDQLVSVVANARRVGHQDVVERVKAWHTDTEIFFYATEGKEIVVRPRRVGSFYRRNLFDYDEAIEQATSVCGNSLLVPGQVRNCPPIAIKVLYEATDHQWFMLPVFSELPSPSFFTRIWKGLICLVGAIVLSLLVSFNVWVAFLAVSVGVGISFAPTSRRP